MAPHPFEDPRKTELRERVSAAIDAAGYELIEPRPIKLPPELQLKGAIIGDIQSIDGDQVVHAFYVRTEWNRAVPQWLANLSLAAHKMRGVKVYIVVEQVSSTIERTCRASGTGLLRIGGTHPYALEQIVNPDEYSAETQTEIHREEVRKLRRLLEGKLTMNLRAVGDNYAKVQELTQGMTPDRRDFYISTVEDTDKRWREWGVRISERLDELSGTPDEEELRATAREIERGAVDEESD
jgi:hypothetical protein